MVDIDTRLLAYGLWGITCLIVYGITFRKRYRRWRKYGDSRAVRQLLTALALFLVALASSLAILGVLWLPAGPFRGFLSAIALGAFVAAGFVMAQEEADDGPTRKAHP